MKYAAKCYLAQAESLFDIIARCEARKPVLNGIKPSLRRDENWIGNSWVTGLPMYDPVIWIEWDVPDDAEYRRREAAPPGLIRPDQSSSNP